MWVQYYDFEKDSVVPFLPIILSAIFLFLVISLFRIRFQTKKSDDRIPLAIEKIFATLFIIVWTIVVTVTLTSGYIAFKDNPDKCMTIEGKITNFIRGKGRKAETFTVKKIKFSYRTGLFRYSTLGYEGRGEIIKAGKYVKIDYYEGQILRLWVLEKTKK
jgi:hypothetical protein